MNAAVRDAPIVTPWIQASIAFGVAGFGSSTLALQLRIGDHPPNSFGFRNRHIVIVGINPFMPTHRTIIWCMGSRYSPTAFLLALFWRCDWHQGNDFCRDSRYCFLRGHLIG